MEGKSGESLGALGRPIETNRGSAHILSFPGQRHQRPTSRVQGLRGRKIYAEQGKRRAEDVERRICRAASAREQPANPSPHEPGVGESPDAADAAGNGAALPTEPSETARGACRRRRPSRGSRETTRWRRMRRARGPPRGRWAGARAFMSACMSRGRCEGRIPWRLCWPMQALGRLVVNRGFSAAALGQSHAARSTAKTLVLKWTQAKER
jgi:hypothetical protein